MMEECGDAQHWKRICMGDGGWRKDRENQQLADTNNPPLSFGSCGLLSVCNLFWKLKRVLGYTAKAACVVVVCSCWDNGGTVFFDFSTRFVSRLDV